MRAEEIIEFGFGAHDAFERAEALQMGFADVGDETEVRFGYLDEFFDVSGMLRAHLYNRHLVRARHR